MKTINLNGKTYSVSPTLLGFQIHHKPSSNVEFYGTDREHGIMFFQFKSGLYLYVDIPADVIEDAARAESIGKFHATWIKGKYECIKGGDKLIKEVENE